ncbi:MAG: 50S ribosomal protein L23 [Verrucomicrobiae bacterium]|nr:50S ribosomal protein L23 [Verrucomicrobiae bacterium]
MKDPFSIVQRVRLTEKGSVLQEKHNAYVLAVAPKANKVEIKQAVEKIFNVKVERVNTMHCLGKKRRQMTKQRGQSSDWKKAVVTLKEGGKIELGI